MQKLYGRSSAAWYTGQEQYVLPQVLQCGRNGTIDIPVFKLGEKRVIATSN